MFFSNHKTTKLARALACGLIASAIAAPAAAAVPADNVVITSSEQQPAPVSDMRSPDSSEPVVPSSEQQAAPVSDMRSPDTIEPVLTSQDVRSPDAVVAHVPEPTAAPASDTGGGFDWSTAGISVAALSGLLILAFAAFGAVRHTRRPGRAITNPCRIGVEAPGDCGSGPRARCTPPLRPSLDGRDRVVPRGPLAALGRRVRQPPHDLAAQLVGLDHGVDDELAREVQDVDVLARTRRRSSSVRTARSAASSIACSWL